MSKSPKPGGRVQIGGKSYFVLEGPRRDGAWFRIMVRSDADFGGGYWAISEGWRGGCGPWKIVSPVINELA
jgi:hypothetical protein